MPIKAEITKVGTIDKDGNLDGFEFDSGLFNDPRNGFDVNLDRDNPLLIAGWTEAELRTIAEEAG